MSAGSTMHSETEPWDEQDLADLRWAHEYLEHPSFAARLNHALGIPMEHAMGMLPGSWREAVQSAVEHSLRRIMDMAVRSLPPDTGDSRNRMHKLLAGGSGALGGFFGPAGLAAELPVTTAVMLRSIADVARCQGENLESLEARLACVEVFALGGRSPEDDAAEAGYYGLRIALSMHLSNLLKSGGGMGIPYAGQFLRTVAARYGVVVSNKAAAQVVPVAGAVTGAALNVLFLDHFQDVARGHFVVRRLERKYGREEVRSRYESLDRTERSRGSAR